MLCAALLLPTGLAWAQEPAGFVPDLPPNAQVTADLLSPFDSIALPASAWADGALAALDAEGAVHRRAWRLGGSATTLQLLAPLREELEAAGFTIRFACETERCGGFDFRLAAPVIPEPAMHVNLGDFRYLLATRGEPPADARSNGGEGTAAAAETLAEPHTVAVLVSRSAGSGFVQVIEVAPAAAPPPPTGTDRAVAEALGLPGPAPADTAANPESGAPSEEQPPVEGALQPPAEVTGTDAAGPSDAPGPDPADSLATDGGIPASGDGPPPGDASPPDLAEDASLGRVLETVGHAALEDLAFAPGSAALTEGSYASLAALAEWMRANPDARILLVGHTDATGSLDANIALSERRAQSVADRLATEHGIERARLAAEGAGFLAPRAVNTTEEGRTANRRVEAVLAPD